MHLCEPRWGAYSAPQTPSWWGGGSPAKRTSVLKGINIAAKGFHFTEKVEKHCNR